MEIPEKVFCAEKPTGEFIKCFGEEPWFRDLEEAFIVDIMINLTQEVWLDLGSKAPLRPNSIFALKKAKIIPVFLYAEESIIINRLQKNNNWAKRSNYAQAGENEWVQLAHLHRIERLQKYIDTSSIIISVDAFDENDLAKEILYRVKEFKLNCDNRSNSFTQMALSV